MNTWKFGFRSGAETCMSALLVSHPCTSLPRVVSLSSRIVSCCYGSSVGTLCTQQVCVLREIPKYECHPHCHGNNVPSKLDFRYSDIAWSAFNTHWSLSHCNSWTTWQLVHTVRCVCVCVCVCVCCMCMYWGGGAYGWVNCQDLS